MSETKALQIVEYQSQRVLTTAQIARVYEVTEQRIVLNFNRNKEKYQESKHYICLEGEALKAFKKRDATTYQIDMSSNNRINKLYLWTEKGAFLHAKSLNTNRAWEVYERLVDEYYRMIRDQVLVPIHTLTDRFRPRALENLLRVPDGYFSVMGELFKHLYNAEALLNQSLDEHAMIEISVGQRWSRYAREVLGIPDQERRKYPHLCQDNRTEHVWAYPIRYVDLFGKWLWVVYFPEQFPAYTRYRARYLSLPVPERTPKKQIVAPTNQLPLFAESGTKS